MKLFDKAGDMLRRVWAEDGLQHVEEALLIALIGVASIAVVVTLSGEINEVFTCAGNSMETKVAAAGC